MKKYEYNSEVEIISLNCQPDSFPPFDLGVTTEIEYVEELFFFPDKKEEIVLIFPRMLVQYHFSDISIEQDLYKEETINQKNLIKQFKFILAYENGQLMKHLLDVALPQAQKIPECLRRRQYIVKKEDIFEFDFREMISQVPLE